MKILREVYGPIRGGGLRKIGNNEELNRPINGEDIVKFIKAQRIRWLRHVKRMEVGAMLCRATRARLKVISMRN